MSHSVKVMLVFACLAGTGVGAADVGDDDNAEAELSRIYLRAGSYFLDSSTRAQVNGKQGNFGSRLDFEDDLNLDERKNTLLAAARWRFRDRHFLEVEYFHLKRHGNEQIEDEIRFGDTVFPIAADLDSTFTTEVTRVGYSYRALRAPDWGVAVSAGLHLTRLRAGLTVVPSDAGSLPAVSREIASVSAPLPVFGLSGARRLSKKWTLLGRGQWFFLKLDDVSGAITHAAVHLEHNTFNNVGFGVGYDWFDIDIDTNDSLWRGSADVQFKGPIIFVQASF